jgi:electron transport complex protein RnfE
MAVNSRRANRNNTSVSHLAKEGLLNKNPLFMQVLGLCPALATSTSAINGLGMGLATASILVCSNFIISLVRKFIPKQIRIAAYIIIISGFVTALEMIFKAYIPALDRSLGIFIPLIVVNCIVFSRAESFAAKNSPPKAALDGLFMGLGFALALFILASVREIIGSGTFMAGTEAFTGIQIFPPDYALDMIASPAGAFFALGILIPVFKLITEAIARKAKRNEKPDGKDASESEAIVETREAKKREAGE